MSTDKEQAKMTTISSLEREIDPLKVTAKAVGETLSKFLIRSGYQRSKLIKSGAMGVVELLADGLGKDPVDVISCIIVKYSAQMAARQEVHGGYLPEILGEYRENESGQIEGKKLFDLLYMEEVDRLTREKLEELKRYDAAYGPKGMNEDDRAFLLEHHVGSEWNATEEASKIRDAKTAREAKLDAAVELAVEADLIPSGVKIRQVGKANISNIYNAFINGKLTKDEAILKVEFIATNQGWEGSTK